MRRLTVDQRGIITPVKPAIRHAGSVTPYVKPNPSLLRIDRLRNGEPPIICITRKQGGIGDVLMTLPAVKAIATKYQVKIDYGTDMHYLDGALQKVLMYNKYINQVIDWNRVNVESYDAVIDLTCPCIAHEKPLAPPINRIDLFARHARIHLTNHDIDYQITDDELNWADNYIYDHNLTRNKLIFVQPFASAINRSAPVDKIKETIKILNTTLSNVKFILAIHDSDYLKVDWYLPNVHLFKNYDIRHIAAMMSKSKLVVCQDSAVLHIASALHHLTLALFGPTDPRARINYHPEAIAVWPAIDLANQPSWYEPLKDGYMCWKLINPYVVAETIMSMVTDQPINYYRELINYGQLINI